MLKIERTKLLSRPNSTHTYFHTIQETTTISLITYLKVELANSNMSNVHSHIGLPTPQKLDGFDRAGSIRKPI
jgi:hypothetical protein